MSEDVDGFLVRPVGYVRSPLADRSTHAVHPRGDPTRPLTGVFATRSQHRPNPVGLHRCQVLEIQGSGLAVRGLEAVDGTPVVDIKVALGNVDDR